jgi:uncharacterized DUF497 family protein
MTVERHTVNKCPKRARTWPAKARGLPSSQWDDVRWDRDKARRNRAKHGVSYWEAQTVLRDPLRSVVLDEAHSTLEDRYHVTGASTTGRILVVIVALDQAGIIRVISARRPTRRERHAYEDST